MSKKQGKLHQQHLIFLNNYEMTKNQRGLHLRFGYLYSKTCLEGIYFCPIEVISRLTDKGQFQFNAELKEPQEGMNRLKQLFFHLERYKYFIS